jgi:hypothetical protein
MLLNLLFSSLIAMAAITPSPAPSTTIAQMQNQSVSSNPSSSPVVIAARNHRFWFRLYVTWIVIAAIASAFFTWMLWKSGNRQQDAVIAETKGDVAKLERNASDAKAAQQRVETDLAFAKTKQAEAERTLLEIQERFVPRTLTGQIRDKFLEDLAGAPRGKIIVSVIANNPEAFTFASQIRDTLQGAGYDSGDNMQSFMPMGSAPLVGLSVGIRDEKQQPPFAGSLQRAFEAIGIKVLARVGDLAPNLTTDTVVIHVGVKP